MEQRASVFWGKPGKVLAWRVLTNKSILTAKEEDQSTIKSEQGTYLEKVVADTEQLQLLLQFWQKLDENGSSTSFSPTEPNGCSFCYMADFLLITSSLLRKSLETWTRKFLAITN